MEKSLLSILDAEQRLVDRIELSEKEILWLQRDRERINASPFECGAKTADLKKCDNSIAACHKQVEEYKAKLDTVREELREYMVALFK